MAPKKAQPKKRTPSPSSSYASSSEDEPENQVKSSQVSAAVAASKASQSAPPAPTVSSSSEDRGGSSDESDSTTEEDNDVNKEHASIKKTPQQQPPKAKGAPPSSELDSESEEDEDEDDDGDDEALPLSQRGRASDPPAKPKVSKPTASKPTVDEAAAGGSRKQQDDKKRKAPVTASPSKSKDKVENNDKKRKVAPVPPPPAKGENGDTPKKRFERIWNPEDELALLRALKTFKNKHGHEPVTPAEVDDLYKSVKTAFHTDFRRPQLVTKLNALKRKYVQASKKKTILDPIAQEASDLAVMIWGERKKGTDAEADGGKPDSAMNGSLDNGGKSSGPLLRPKAEFVESAHMASEKAKGDAPDHGSLSLKELVSFPGSDNGRSAILDFIANQFDWMDRGSLSQSIARLDSAGCKTLEEIWDRLKNREMQFQLHRLEAATDMIKVVKGEENL